MNLCEHILINPAAAINLSVRTDEAVYMSSDYLVSLGINDQTMRSFVSKYTKGVINTWANVRINGKRYVDYDTIDWPNVKPFKQGRSWPDKHVLIAEVERERQELREQATRRMTLALPTLWAPYYSPDDERWYREQMRVNEGRGGAHPRSEDMATGMAILRWLYANDTVAAIRATTSGAIQSKRELQAAVVDYLKQMSPAIYRMPQSYDNLRKLCGKYKVALKDQQDPREVLLHGNTGNDSAKKLDERQELIMQELYLQPNKPDMMRCWLDYVNHFIMKYNMSEDDLIGYSRFKQYFSTPQMQLIGTAVRDGSAFYEAIFRPFVLGKMPQYSMSLLSGDGWEPGRSVTFRWYNKKENKWQMRTGTMNVWYWYDWKSKYIASHRIAGFENSEQIRASFRDIIALYDGRVPRSVMMDSKWWKNPAIKRMMEKAGVFKENKRAYSPKTNAIERNNKEMNKLHRQLDEHWVNMTGNTQRFKHNEDHIRGVQPLTEEEFDNMVMQLIHLHNNTRYKSLGGKTPREVFYDSINPDCRVIDPLEQTWLFGDHTITTVRNFTVKVEIATRKYLFVIPNESKLKLIKEVGKDWRVKVYYDERHMDTVEVYAFSDKDSEHTDRHICTAINAEDVRVSRSSVEGNDDPDHGRKLGYQQRGVEMVDDYIQDFMAEREELASRIDLDLVSVKSTSQERYKEAKSDATARVYTGYYANQTGRQYDDGSDVGVTTLDMPAADKLAALEKEVGDSYSDDE